MSPYTPIVHRYVSACAVLFLFFVAIAPDMLMAATSCPRQEVFRELTDVESNTKFLTPGEVDGWAIEAKQNEILIVQVNTNEFDATLGLSKITSNQDENADGEAGQPDEKRESEEVLFSIDENGSNSHFYHRIQQAGKYRIRVHGFQMKGGGNYSLNVQRFPAQQVEPSKAISAKFDKEGKASFFFNARFDQNLVMDFNGAIQIYNDDGQTLQPNWADNFLIPADGEYLVSVRGSANKKCTGEVRLATRDTLALGESKRVATKPKSLNIWEMEGEAGQFRVLSVSRSSAHSPRLLFAPLKNPNEKTLEANTYQEPALQHMHLASKGSHDSYAVVFQHNGRYQLQAYSNAESEIEVSMTDPTIDLGTDNHPSGQLDVGGTAFYGFQAKAGDLLNTRLSSKTFDCWLRLYDSKGRMVTQNDDFKASRNSEISHLITRPGYYRWHVASLGDGGGGPFQLKMDEIPKKQIDVGTTKSSELATDSTEYWSLESETSKSVVVNVRGTGFPPKVQVQNSRGRYLGSTAQGGVGDTMIAFKIPAKEKITIRVSSPQNRSGNYRIRVLDTDWDE